MPRQAELVEVGANRLGGKPRVTQRRDRRTLGPLRELLAVVADDESMVDHLRRLVPERAMERGVQRLVRPVIGTSDDVRDPEVEVVDDARQVERRRAVVAPEHHALEALRQPGFPGRLQMALGARALPRRPVVPDDPEPAQIVEHALLAAGDISPGSVSSMRSSSQSPKSLFATALRAFPTWSEPVGLGAKRTRFMPQTVVQR